MNPIQKQLDAKPLDWGLGLGFGSFTFVHGLEANTRTVVDPMHREVNAKFNNLEFGFGSFAFLHNVEDV